MECRQNHGPSIFFSRKFAILGDESLAVPNLVIVNKLAKWMEKH